jgi:hypothetical protein
MSIKPKRHMSINALRLFLSYSHKDDKLRQELSAHLSPLRQQGLIAEWTDRKIGAGSEWKDEISSNLSRADLIVLMISADFINSDYCYGVEFAHAQSKHAEGIARVIPVIARPCRWQAIPLANLQVLPAGGKPITRWGDRDSAYLSVVQGIENVARSLLASSEGLVTDWLTSLLYRRKVVREVQLFLRARQLYRGPIDGEPESVRLKDAVRKFQREMGIGADGLIGPVTLRTLLVARNAELSSE